MLCGVSFLPMFTVGDYVINKETGHFGKVIGYGQILINHLPSVTLQVFVRETRNCQRYELIIEDEISSWSLWCVPAS